MTSKQWKARWNVHAKMIISTTEIDINETDKEKNSRIAALEAEPEKWFKYYFPAYAFAQPAGFHIRAAKRVLQNKEWCEVRMWSRELAKSTRTMMEVFYLTLVGHVDDTPNSSTPHKDIAAMKKVSVPRHRKRCVLLISNSLDNAARLLLPYRANLQLNKRIIQDYGLQQSTSQWSEGEFITLNGVSFRALGAGQSPRGTRNEEVRPDIILFDDVDTDADCLNPEIVAKKWRWIEEAAIGTRSVSQPTTIIFCGNRIAAQCCIDRAVAIADHTDEINIRNAAGRSSWPQKNKELDIDRVLSQKSYAAVQKEYFNNPITEGSVFKQMAYKPARQLSDYDVLVCYTDPSYKDTHDYKATVLVGKWQDEFHIIKCYLAQTTTAAMIEWHYNIMDLVGNCGCYYYMEEVFMQDVIVKEVSSAGAKRGKLIPIRGDTRKKPAKFMRIESLLEPLHRNGQLYLNEAERDNPNMVRLVDQFLALAPGSYAHDDGPDAVEGAIWIINGKLSKTRAGIRTSARHVNDKRF